MYIAIKKLATLHPDDQAEIINFNIETPKGDYESEIETPIISGWALLKNQETSTLVIYNNNRKHIITTNIQRNDVTTFHFGKPNPSIKCGFSEEIHSEGSYKIYIATGSKEILLAEIDIILKDSDLTQEQIKHKSKKTWLNFIHNNLDEILESDIKALQIADKETVVNEIFGRPINFTRDIGELSKWCHENNSTSSNLEQLVSRVLLDGFGADLIYQATEAGCCTLPNPFGEGEAKCNQSFHPLMNITVLRFVTPSGETFFIIQQALSMDAIYFPSRGVIFSQRYNLYETIKNIVITICQKFRSIFAHTKNQARCTFGGVIAGYHRPFHFYYDTCLGLLQLSKRNGINKTPKFITYSGAEFFPLTELFGLHELKNITYFNQLEEISSIENKFFITIGENGTAPQKRFLIEELDELIIAKADQILDETTKAEITHAKTCYPLVWFGITSDKRAWVEQIAGGVQIISDLFKIYPHLAVIFDGWTSPLKKTETDIVETKKDQTVIDKITQQIPYGVSVFNTNGSNSIRKIAFAKAADVFIANYSTGSLHIARFAKKHGVGHLSNSFMKGIAEHQIHPHTFTIPPEEIIDIPDPDNPKVEYVSYSIDPTVIFNLTILALMTK